MIPLIILMIASLLAAIAIAAVLFFGWMVVLTIYDTDVAQQKLNEYNDSIN
jgi:hypothetical protein